MDHFIGTTLLGYTILREIGEGGMGKVYLAENQMIGQQVAVKILDPILARNTDLRERFAQEARIQVSLQHQNIVRVLNAQSSDELSFLIMEYIDGQSLDKVLERRGKLSVDEAIKIFTQVLDAVGHAHKKGIIHRDIKPSNIIVCADGTAKVTDFGIAKIVGDTKLTRTGTSMGSPDYMSPEQVLGKKDIDHRTDIYSLGATLYEMLTGRPPFVIENGGSSDSDFLTKAAHVASIPQNPSSATKSISTELNASILQALRKEPCERFSSCAEFSIVLSRVLESESDLSSAKTKVCYPLARESTSNLIFYRLGLLVNRIFFVKSRRNFKISFFLIAIAAIALIIFIKSTTRVSLGAKCWIGHPRSCLNLGVMLDNAATAKVEKFEIRKLYSKACDGNVLEGCFNLGLMLLNGEGSSSDISDARRLFFKACSGGDAASCVNLGVLNHKGEGGPKDEAEARRLFSKACEAGDGLGCMKFGISLRREVGGPLDSIGARRAFLQACEKHEASGCYFGGEMLHEGEGGPMDKVSARRLFSKSCQMGYTSSCSALIAALCDAGLINQCDGKPDPFSAQLLLDYSSLINSLVQQMETDTSSKLNSNDFNDHFSDGVIGLLEAIQFYDPSSREKFGDFAEKKIRDKIKSRPVSGH